MFFTRFQSIVIACLALLVCVVTGCRTTSNDRCERAIALLRAEKIDLEDKYYSLEARYERLLEESGYPEGHTLPKSLKTPDSGYQIFNGDSLRTPEILPPGNLEPEVISPGQDHSGSYESESNVQSASTEIPEIIIETGDFSVLDNSIGNPKSSSVGQGNLSANNSGPTLQLPSPNRNRNRNSDQNPRDTQRVNQSNNSQIPNQSPPIAVNENQIAAYITDLIVDCDTKGQRPETSWLIVQPVDENRSAIPLVGDVTVSLIDPAKQGAEQRVGLWNFNSARIENWIRENGSDVPGIHIPRPASIRFRELEGLIAFVRYRAVNGQVFEKSVDLDQAALVASRTENPGNIIQDGRLSDSSVQSESDIEWSPDR